MFGEYGNRSSKTVLLRLPRFVGSRCRINAATFHLLLATLTKFAVSNRFVV
jgi:hypothetical protein